MFTEVPLDLKESLRSLVRENVEQYFIEMVTNEEGQGFLGEIVFVTLTHKKTQEKIQLVVKQELKGSEKTEEELTLLYQNEINFYQSIWPFLKEYYKKVSGNDLDIVPKCFSTCNNGKKRILMENIKTQGYVLYDKSKPFDDEHFRIIFKTYGIYHGISMALREKDIKKYNQLISQQKNMYKKAFENENGIYCKAFVNKVKDILQFFDPKTEKHILDKLEVYVKYGSKILKQLVTEEFPKGVLLHGDCWSNNLMFKYDDQRQVRKVKFLDFQSQSHNTPVLDLSCCLYSGASAKVLNRLDDYLRIYHTSLTETLKKFDLIAEEIYSLETLTDEWKRYCKLCFITGLHLWKLKLIDMNKIPDFAQALDAPLTIAKNNEENFKHIVRDLCFHMYNNNFF